VKAGATRNQIVEEQRKYRVLLAKVREDKAGHLRPSRNWRNPPRTSRGSSQSCRAKRSVSGAPAALRRSARRRAGERRQASGGVAGHPRRRTVRAAPRQAPLAGERGAGLHVRSTAAPAVQHGDVQPRDRDHGAAGAGHRGGGRRDRDLRRLVQGLWTAGHPGSRERLLHAVCPRLGHLDQGWDAVSGGRSSPRSGTAGRWKGRSCTSSCGTKETPGSAGLVAVPLSRCQRIG